MGLQDRIISKFHVLSVFVLLYIYITNQNIRQNDRLF